MALTLAASAFATPPASKAVDKIEPSFFRASRTGLASSASRFKLARNPAVLIELDHAATAADFAKLRAAGVELELSNGVPIAYDRFVAARVDERAARAIAPLPEVRRVSLTAVNARLPLDHSAELLRLDDARGAVPAMDRLTGQGILIADEDSLVEVFEPAFFHGDGGYYDWIDVNKDGVFTPDVDAVDLDANGTADPSEKGSVVSVNPVDFYGNVIDGIRSTPSFDPGIDWIYIDTNGNKKRDYGPTAGFDETTPGYGEPIFTPDDVNRNGKLDVGERLVRLGTSKFKAVRVDVNYLKTVNKTFTRGTDLIQTPTDITGGQLYGFPDAYHATGVSTILAGDLPLVGRRWVGIAPDADIVTSFDVENTGDGLPATGETWLLQQKPDVMLHELALWAAVPLDGTDALSKLIDTSVTKDNVTQTCPTGDQGSALKHARSTIAASGNASLAFNIPSTTLGGAGPLKYVDLSLNVTGGDLASGSVALPGGADNVPLTNNATGTLTGGAQYYVTEQTTTRGTRFWDVVVYAQATGSALPVGDGTLQLTASSAPLTVDAYIEDDKSSWAVGAAWDKAIATDAHTVGVPSVADHCIAVGAAPNHVGDAANPEYDLTFYVEYNVPQGYEETQNQVRAYSPRGPRIDGVQKPDILAPDNPWTAVSHDDSSSSPYGSYGIFGGTSGASPHVTGAAALLAQAGIRGDAARDAIRNSAMSDGTEGALPNGDYGYGHLDVAKALGVSKDGITPTVALAANPSTAPANSQVQLTATVSGGDGLQVKYDDGYDGTWDTEYAGADPRGVTSDHAGVVHYKVRVRNSSGRIAEAVTSVTFTPAVDNGTNGSGSSGGCGCHASRNEPKTAAFVGLGLAALLVARRRRKS